MHSFAPFFKLKISAKNRQHLFAIEKNEFSDFSFFSSKFAFFLRFFYESLPGFRDRFQKRGRYTATTPTAWEATTSVRRPRSLLLVRRFFAVRYFRFSHCAAFIISSPGRGLSFSLCCLSPSPFFVDYVPFSTEYRSFRSASSIACARKKKTIWQKNWDFRAVQRSALCRSRRELSNAYLLAKFGFDTAENEPCQICPIEQCSSPAIDRFQRDKSDPSVIVFSDIKRCQLPHSTQFFQKAKMEALLVE